MLPTSASFLVTENCNLACRYCFENKGRNGAVMSEEVALAALEMLSSNALKEYRREFKVIFFGGEPLMNIGLMDYIFHKGLELAKEKGLKFTSMLITNGTIMNEDIFNVLKWHRENARLVTQISVDGMADSHDLYRVTRDGKGSFALVEKNIGRFKEIYAENMHDLCVHSCINKRTVGKIFDNYRFFRNEWGMESIWFLPVAEENWSEEDVRTYDEQYGMIYGDIVKELAGTGNLGLLSRFSPMDRCMVTGFTEKPCAAGDGFVTVAANGDIYPCHQFYFNNPEHDLKFGNVLDGGITAEDIRKPFVEYDRICLSCDKDCANVSCYRCIAANYTNNGNMLEQIRGNYCGLMAVNNKYQEMLRARIHELGLIRDNRMAGNNEGSAGGGDCLCNARNSSNFAGNCDIVTRQSVCESGNNPDNPDCLCDINTGNPNIGLLPDRIQEDDREAVERDFKNAVSYALRIIMQDIREIKEILEHNGQPRLTD